MPFLAPLIGAAIGGIAASTIGTAVIGAALSVAMGAISRRLAPKADADAGVPRGAHLQLAADSQMPRVLLFGEAAVAGSLVYHNVYNTTKNLEMVIALADHECEAMTGLWIDGKPATWDSGTGLVTEFPGMRVRFYSGAWSQTADADLVANSGGRWTSDDRGRGIAYAAIDMAYDAELYKGRQPSFLFKIKGAKLYDWRKDSTAGGSGAHRWATPSTYEWTENPVVVWYNYRRGIFTNGVRVAGMATAADAMPLDAATAGANACDELVDLAAGGTEKRYRISAAVVTAQVHREVIRDIVATTAGEEIDTGGELRFAPGIAQAAVMALTDDDMMRDADIEWSGKQSRRDLLNAAFGSWRDPAQRYDSVSVVPRTSSADETVDGARLEQRYDLDMVTTGTQAQRVLEILRRRARRQGTVKTTFRAKTCVLEAGDWITWTSARFGWELKEFEVVSASPAHDLTTELVLREIDVDVYAWDPATDELDPGETADLPAGGGGLTSIAGLTVSNILVTSTASAAERPGLRLEWTPITDPSVVEIEIETRRLGDTAALNSRKAYDAGAGQSSWVDGIQGGTTYEVRARPVTLPKRSVSWSAWISPEVATAAQKVDVGVLIPEPESVGPDELDAQTLFELRLATAIAELQGSAAEKISEAYTWAQQAGEEALRALLNAQDVKAQVRVETIERSTETTALAAQITSATTAIAGNTASITELLESVDGISARWGVAININGQVVGLVQLDGDATESTFQVLADKFIVAKPDGTGGTPVFIVGNIAGAPAVGINGNLVIDGTILARHIAVTSLSAIVANIGTITAGRLQNAGNTTYFDLNTGEFQITAAS